MYLNPFYIISARAFESVSIMIFLLMLILMAKGYTITRGKLSNSSTIKITVFMTLYTITYVVIFIWEAIVSLRCKCNYRVRKSTRPSVVLTNGLEGLRHTTFYCF